MFENISPQRREVIVSRDGNHCFYRAVASVFMVTCNLILFHALSTGCLVP